MEKDNPDTFWRHFTKFSYEICMNVLEKLKALVVNN
jgi:hypothetical protein